MPSRQREFFALESIVRFNLRAEKEPKVETDSADLVVDQKPPGRYEGRFGGKSVGGLPSVTLGNLATELMAL